MTRSDVNNLPEDSFEIGHASPERASAANEVGAAIAHELSGPLTALLLYVGDLNQSADQFHTADGDGQSLKLVVENALRETERVCSLMRRISEAFEASLPNESAIAYGREVIRWWSQISNTSEDAEAQAARAIRKPLTRREREVLRLVSEGCSNKVGGLLMKISHRTFESHRAAVMRKFRAKNAADLIRLSRLLPEEPNSDQARTAVRE